MAEVKVKFTAETAQAQKQLDELRKIGEETKKRLAEGGSGDRRTDLEALRAAKEQLAAAEAEKREIQEKIKLQAQSVRQAQEAVNATKEGTAEHRNATRELEKQRGIMSNLTGTARVKGQTVDVARNNYGLARQVTRIVPKVDTAPAVTGFARIRAAATSTVAKIKSGFAGASASFSKAFTGMKAAAGAALAYVGINSVKGVINELDNLSKHARSLDIDTASFQKLKYAADSNNVSFEQVESSIGKMKRTIGEAANGSAEAKNKLAMLGLTVKDLQGKTTAQQFDLIAQSITSIQDPAKRTAAAMKWFEEGGAKMMDFLRNYKQQGEDLAARGAIIDDKQLKAAEDFNQSLTNISTTLKGLAVNSGLIGQLTEVIALLDAAGFTNERTENMAAVRGVYNRRTATGAALKRMEQSGKYSPEQMEKIRIAGHYYAKGVISSDQEQSLIDAELKKMGLAALARRQGDGVISKARGFFGLKTMEFGEDTTATATQTKEEKRAAAERLLQEKARRQKEAEERKRNMLQSKIDAQVQGLTAPSAPAAPAAPSAPAAPAAPSAPAAPAAPSAPAAPAAPSAPAAPAAPSAPAAPAAPSAPAAPAAPVTPEKAAFIQAELDKAAKAAEEVGIALSARQRDQVTDAAGARYDQIHSEKQAKLDSEIKKLEEKYRLQQMINQGKGKEAAIEEALARARKQAEGLGTKLTADQEQRIRTVTAASYTLANPEKTAAEPKTSARRINPAVVTNSLASRGGFAGSIVSIDSDHYNRSIAQTSKQNADTLTQIRREIQKLTGE